MPRFSKAFGIKKSQAEVDFVDIPLHTDVWLFIDPFAISQRVDPWSQQCHRTLAAFFQRVIDKIRTGRSDEARELLSRLREPNETHFGLSADRSAGAGIGSFQAQQLFEALRDSSAVKTGFLSSLEECELMIEGIGRDKISDLTTNIIRAPLVEYTKGQCHLHGIATQTVALKHDRGLIVPLDDERLANLLELVRKRKREEIDSVIASLINEVWVA